jgi:hypothetical protein
MCVLPGQETLWCERSRYITLLVQMWVATEVIEDGLLGAQEGCRALQNYHEL